MKIYIYTIMLNITIEEQKIKQSKLLKLLKKVELREKNNKNKLYKLVHFINDNELDEEEIINKKDELQTIYLRIVSLKNKINNELGKLN